MTQKTRLLVILLSTAIGFAGCSEGPGDGVDGTSPAAETGGGTTSGGGSSTSGGGSSSGSSSSSGDTKGPDACLTKTGKTGDVVLKAGAMGNVSLHVPAKVDPKKPTMVVLNFHGLFSDGAQHALVSGMSARADAKNFIVAHPSGGGQSWNGGECCGDARTKKRDDVAATKELLKAIGEQYCVDESRVFATGFSNGGFLVNRLGCEMSDSFAAIASVSGTLGLPDAACSPKRAVAYLHIHGTGDTTVPYNGGKPQPLGPGGQILLGDAVSQIAGTFRSVADTTTFWKNHDKCTGDAKATLTKDDTTCTEWSACADGSAVALCSVKDMGHNWPGGFPNPTGGKYSATLKATDTIIEFFEKHPMK